MEHILEGSCSLSKLWSVDSEERILSVTTLSRKCSIMALAKCNEEGGLIWSDIKEESDYPYNNNNLICFSFDRLCWKIKMY